MKFHNKIFYQIKHIPAMLGLTAITMSACDDKPVIIEKEPEIITQHDTIYTPRNDTIYTPRSDTIYVPRTDTINAGRIDTVNLRKSDVVFFLKKNDPTIETVREYANCDTIANIYLDPSREDWSNNYFYYNIISCRNGLQQYLDISSKIRGRGNFNFTPGEASKIPTDSLWFVQNGWTINKQK